MIFTVTCRGGDGALREEPVEAASRAACIAACKTRGITPVAIKEGRGGHAPGSSPKRKLCTVHYCLFAAVVALAAVAMWWFGGRGATALPVEKPVKPRAEKQPKKTRGTPAPRVAEKPSEPLRRPQAQDAGGAAGRTAAAGAGPRVVSVVTDDAGFILTTVEENGKTTIQTDTLHPPVFKNPMHQLIAAAVAGSGDSEIAPLPLGPGDEAAMREALKVEIKDLPDDTEEIKRMKDSVRATKEDIAALLDKGISVSEIFTEHRELWNENLKIRNEMKASFQRFLREDDAEAAAQYLEKINSSFREMGIPEITPEEMQSGGKRKRRTQE